MPNGYIKSKTGDPIELVDALARTKMHEHENKDILDAITEERVAEWDAGGGGGGGREISATLDGDGMIIVAGDVADGDGGNDSSSDGITFTSAASGTIEANQAAGTMISTGLTIENLVAHKQTKIQWKMPVNANTAVRVIFKADYASWQGISLGSSCSAGYIIFESRGGVLMPISWWSGGYSVMYGGVGTNIYNVAQNTNNPFCGFFVKSTVANSPVNLAIASTNSSEILWQIDYIDW